MKITVIVITIGSTRVRVIYGIMKFSPIVVQIRGQWRGSSAGGLMMQRLFSEAVIVAGNSYTKETSIGPFRLGGIAVCEVVPEVGDINYR